MYSCTFYNSLPKGKILYLNKLKPVAHYKFNVAKVMISIIDRVEEIGPIEQNKLSEKKKMLVSSADDFILA